MAVLALTFLAPSATAQIARVANTTLNMPPALPMLGFTTERALNNLGFDQPIAVVSAPGETNRLFVVEKPGRIVIVHNPGSANPTTSLFLDISATVYDNGEGGLLALAFHPDYATNGYFYVWYTLSTTTAPGEGLHDRLARFRVSAADPNVADAGSEEPLISQFDQAENHNGGEIKFGPDGYLYLSTGDEGGGGDPFQNGQRIDKDFFSSVIRIDVDQRPGSLVPNPHPSVHAGTYRIPPDNPFVGATSFNGSPINPANVRTEIWAIGLRNPFRMSFDSGTGQLWLADVGQDLREEINIITRGGNYGWNFREGSIAHTGTPPAEAVFTEPVHDYSHSDGYSVTGGLVYRGAALSQLYGAYLFADYGSGAIWSLRYNDTTPAEVQQLTSSAGIVGFGLNPANGDILLANINEGSIRRLVYNSTSTGTSLPATLSDTGAFSSLGTLTPAPGVVAYEPNVSFWSDHAKKRRWFSVPGLADKITFAPEGNWSFPAGTVWVKHFELELTRGDPSTARRLETRFLVKTAGSVYGVTYKWNAGQTEATLVPEEGENESISIVENGTPRQQVWRYPSRAECMQCHTAVGGHALSFNTAQLNRSVTYESVPANQLAALAAAGYFTAPTLPDPGTLGALAPANDSSATLEHRVRSYLASNCVQCHQPGGAALGNWDARIQTPMANTGLIDGTLVNLDGDSANRVIAPGDPAHSMMLARTSTRGSNQMPPLGSSELDNANIALLTAWINAINTVTFTSHPTTQTVTVGTPVTFTALAVGSTTPIYQWKKNGVDIGGATNSTYTISNPGMDDAGAYTVVATIGVNSATSNTATLVVNEVTSAPVFTTHPASQSITASDAVTFTSAASGTPAPTYQWRKGGVDIVGATDASYTIAGAVTDNAGSYTVVATNTVNSATSNVATLTVNKAAAIISLSSLNVTFSGSAHAASAVTTPSSLTVNFSYDGSVTPPTNAGTYAVVATIDDINYHGSASGSLVIAKANATVTLGNLSATYDGAIHPATAVTSPTSLATNFTYNGSAITPTGAGTYAVVATVNDPNYQGSASGSLVIAKATPAITWATPAGIQYGTALSSTQLSATANTPGAFSYHPASGTVLDIGSQTLNATFTPVDTTNYTGATATQTITVNPVAPSIVTSPTNRIVAPGQSTTFSVVASGHPTPTYQWQLLPAGGGTRLNLTDGGSYSGTTTSMLLVSNSTLEMNGDQVRCVATNIGGAVASNSALLTVTTATIAPNDATISFTVE